MRIYTTCPGCGEYIKYLGSRRNLTHAFCRDPCQPEWDLQDAFLAAASAGDDARADRLAASLEALQNRPPRLGAAALRYATDYGWPVFPLLPGQKVPATRHGFHDATSDKQTVREWWRRWPSANIGVPTGRLFDVLDVDFKHGAGRVWPDLRDAEEHPAAHGISLTAGGGLHVLLLPTGGGNFAGGLPGLDYRGEGGYVVVPPSVLADGRRYSWDVYPSPMVKARCQRPPEPAEPPRSSPVPAEPATPVAPVPAGADEPDPNQTALFPAEGVAAP